MSMKIKINKDCIIEGHRIYEGSVIEVLDESEYMEMAKSWSEIQKELRDELYVRHEHLIKLFYYRGQNYYDNNFEGWVASAKKGFNVSKLRNTNSYPKAEKIYNEIWLKVEDSFDDFHEVMVSDLNDLYTDFEKIEEIKYKEVYDFVQRYNLWASEILSKKGNISMNETRKKIKELLGLYD